MVLTYSAVLTQEEENWIPQMSSHPWVDFLDPLITEVFPSVKGSIRLSLYEQA